MNSANVNSIVLDFKASYGSNFGLAEVIEKKVFDKETNKPTDELEYRYDIVCADKKMKHIIVKIPGKKLMETPEDIVMVKLTDVVAKPFILNGQLFVSISASGISEIK